jgi:hypothetical protein
MCHPKANPRAAPATTGEAGQCNCWMVAAGLDRIGKMSVKTFRQEIHQMEDFSFDVHVFKEGATYVA